MILIHGVCVCNEETLMDVSYDLKKKNSVVSKYMIYCFLFGWGMCVLLLLFIDDILCFLFFIFLKISYLYNISYIIYFLINSVQNFFLLSLNLLIVNLLLYFAFRSNSRPASNHFVVRYDGIFI